VTGVRGLAHINLHAPAALIARVRQFYIDIIGLREGPRPNFGTKGHWLYAGDTDVLHLSVHASGEEPRTTGWIDHIAFSCTDLAQTCQRLDHAGIPYRLDTVDSLNQMQLFVRDPAGIAVELNFPIDVHRG
jgi:catechol 2,3-dioxygenase-like lactoylglutathione lyase family enzyme